MLNCNLLLPFDGKGYKSDLGLMNSLDLKDHLTGMLIDLPLLEDMRLRRSAQMVITRSRPEVIMNGA